LKVMVTGGAGFIGSHVVDMLVSAGYRVSVVDDLSTGRFENINPGVNFYRVKIEGDDFGRVVERERPDAVIHHAAQVDVARSMNEPLKDAGINVLGSVNLLENCRRYRVGKVIYASSAAVYGSPAYLPVDEGHPVAPQSPYGVSKHTVEHYLRIYQEVYGVRYTVLRYANVFGPRQDASGEGGVVAIFIDCLLKGKRVKIFGDGRQTRDFVYAGDVACANLAALNFFNFLGHSQTKLFDFPKLPGAVLLRHCDSSKPLIIVFGQIVVMLPVQLREGSRHGLDPVQI
jgi:UDP-glucose 4-epimerase